MAVQGFWDDLDKSTEYSSYLKKLKTTVNEVDGLKKRIDDLKGLLEISEDDEGLLAELKGEISEAEKIAEEVHKKTFFSDELDYSNAILSVHPGAGGTESCDWASMLLRMYMRWAEEKGFAIEVADLQKGEEAGIKSATVFIKGEYAFGLLKSEVGVHRLVRISPFDSNKRRHTSFASIDCLPEVAEEVKIEIKDEELRIDTYRSSGAGGQHVNVTDSAVRITHLPTGIVVQCQNERSQHKNKAFAMKILKARLFARQEAEKKKELDRIRGERKDIAWGSQIRSYVFHPYLLVKDHRTNFESGDAKSVIDGEIDRFIWAYLQFKNA